MWKQISNTWKTVNQQNIMQFKNIYVKKNSYLYEEKYFTIMKVGKKDPVLYNKA